MINFKKYVSKLWIGLFVACILCGMIPPQNVDAKVKWKAKYKVQMEKDNVSYPECATYYDIDKDGIPECIVCNGGGDIDIAYTIVKGKVKKISDDMTHAGYAKISKKYYYVTSDHYNNYFTFYTLKSGILKESFSINGREYFQGIDDSIISTSCSITKNGVTKNISDKKYNNYVSKIKI